MAWVSGEKITNLLILALSVEAMLLTIAMCMYALSFLLWLFSSRRFVAGLRCFVASSSLVSPCTTGSEHVNARIRTADSSPVCLKPAGQ